MKLKLIIAAGGGGHFAPALSVIEKIPNDWEVIVFGRKYPLEGDKAISLEYQTCQKRGIPFESITTGRVQRKLTRFTFLSLLKIPFGFFQSFFLLLKHKPHVVLSFGGYVSVPICFSAFLLRIPVIIHEQTLTAGLASKVTSVFATKICISWESSRNYFPTSKTILTGNPLQLKTDKIGENIFPSSQEKFPLILVVGGSSGSHAINVFIEKILVELLEKYKVILQTGDSQKFQDSKRFQELQEKLPKELESRFKQTAFINPSDMSHLLQTCSLVISRGGINTLSQLIYFKKPSLIIPLTISQNNEQMNNAKFLKELGLGEIAIQEETTPESLLNSVNHMMQHIDSYTLQKNIHFPKHPEEEIIEIVKNVSKAS